jgi:dTDP-4-amino-4,6-dideoxygalactose transaminase
MAKILLTLDVLLDAFLGRKETSKKLVDKLAESDHDLFITSSIIPALNYFLTKYGADKKKFKEIFFRRFKIISTTGYEGILSLDYEDSEEALAFFSFKRAVGDGIVITSDKNYKEFEAEGLKILTPQEALESPEIFGKDSYESIPILDLKKEYHYAIEEIDYAILKSVAEAKYILGPEVDELEKKVAEYLDVKHCIACSSGTDALTLSLRALAIKIKKREYWDKDDLIITTPFTFVATGDSILRSGATPLFVDIELDTYTLSSLLVKKAIKKYGRRVKGIIPVHLYGHPCDMDELLTISKENDLFVVEDCAQSFGASWNNKKTGSFGDLGCFSFFPSKNLGGFGDGGMVSTNNDELAEIVRMLIKHGGKDKYNAEHIGYNARLDTIQAAILLAKFKYIDKLNNMRRKIAQIYNEGLKDVAWLKLPTEREKAYHVYHQYTVLLMGKNRKEVQEKLKQKGISTMVYYPYPLHKMKVFSDRMVVFEELGNAEIASENVLSLPIEPLFNERKIKLVIEALKGC